MSGRFKSKSGKKRRIAQAYSTSPRKRFKFYNRALTSKGSSHAGGPFRNPIARWGRVYGGSLLPENLRTTFKYHATWSDTSATGFAQYCYRANSIYDPDLSGVGTKAIGVTAMANIYNRYRVIASKMQFTVVNNDADDPVHIAIVPQKTATALAAANKESVPSQPGCAWDIVTNQTGKGTVQNYVHVGTLCGNGSSNQETFTATLSNNPATECYYIIYIWNESGNALACEGSVAISYDTVLSDIDYAGITGA